MTKDQNRIKLLDGIRGFAVTLVVLYHFYPGSFPGGFSGVEIFFMLSGYLITKAIIRIHTNGKKYSLIEFYKSRILRIFPATLAIIFFVLAIGWFILNIEELEQAAKHSIYSISQILNFMLWHESGYFDNDSKYKVFLHMWSISIEWQLYLVAPIIILFLSKTISLIKIIGFITLTGSIITMFLYIYASEYHPVGAYYFTPLRSWAFFFGASLYLLENQNINNTIGLDHAHWIQIRNSFFLKIIIVALLLINILILPSFLNFGYINVISVLIVSLLFIFKPQLPQKRVFIFLGKCLVLLGLISFSVYLWHWPILYFLRILGWDSFIFVLELGILITLIFSWLTYTFIESTFNRSIYRNRSILILFFMGILISGISIVFIIQDGVKSRYTLNDLKPTSNYLINDCESVKGVIDSYCRTTENPKVVLLGDSHADLLMNALIESKHKTFSNVLSLTAGNCQPSIGTESREGCNKHINESLEKLKGMTEVKFALITSWNGPTENSDVNDYVLGYSKLFNTLINYGIEPIFIVDNPTLTRSPRGCYESLYGTQFRKSFSSINSFCFDITKESFHANKEYKYIIKELSEIYKDIKFIDSFNVICPDLTCSLNQDNQVIYSDEGHLSYFSSKKLIENIINIIDI